jgi:Family of unknown function (DUF5856)
MDPLMVNILVGIEQQLRILHWQTNSYAQHKAFGDTYAALGDLIDSFMEGIMGKYGRFELQNTSIQVINMAELDLEDFVNGSAEFLTSLSGQLNPETDTELLNIRDEMLQQISKLKYLLTLK